MVESRSACSFPEEDLTRPLTSDFISASLKNVFSDPSPYLFKRLISLPLVVSKCPALRSTYNFVLLPSALIL